MTLKSLTFTALAVCIGLLAGETATAQTLREVPANIPPDSFSGRQFVDNRGCVYIRAGVDGATTWVPRVTRQREQLCGLTPTFGGGSTATAAAAPAPAPQPRPAPEPVQITIAPQAAAPAPEPAAQTTTALRPAPAETQLQSGQQTATLRRATQPQPVLVPKQAAPAPSGQTTVRRIPAPAVQTSSAAPQETAKVVRVTPAPTAQQVAKAPPRVVRRVPQASEPAAAPQQATRVLVTRNGQVACPGLSEVSARYMRSDGRIAVRCGPQQTPHVTVIRRGEAPVAGKRVYDNTGWPQPGLSGATRIVPRHVYERLDTTSPHVPQGFRPAWDDDRLNTHRAFQTVDGYHRTQQVWTNTVPRQLVVQSGQAAEVKEPVIAYRGTAKVPAAQTQASGRKASVSTRSAPSRPAATGSARYVEIGVFTTQGKADAAARRLRAAGLPVKYGMAKRGGQTVRHVLVGPYSDSAALNTALKRVHGTGYTQAYLR